MDAPEQWAKDRQSVLVSLATRGAATFYEHRGYTSKAGYYKKYLAAAARTQPTRSPTHLTLGDAG